MKTLKEYKIILPYTESASLTKKYKIEYVVSAENVTDAIKKAELKFNEYQESSSASWVRIPDQSSLRVWRVLPNDPTTPEFIDELINQLHNNTDKSKILESLEKLGKLEDTFASSNIISLMKSDDIEIISKAIETLGNIGDKTSFFAVKNAYYQKDNPEIKITVTKNLIKLALPEDNVLDFYKIAIKDSLTRETVFKIEDPVLLPLCIAEINKLQEFEEIKRNCLNLGSISLEILLSIDIDNEQIFNNASKLASELKQMGFEKKWKKWSELENKYNL